MLNIVIEIWPYGDSASKREIGGFQLANDGTGDRIVGNYIYRKDDSEDWSQSVKGHHRDSDVEELVYKALKIKYDK